VRTSFYVAGEQRATPNSKDRQIEHGQEPPHISMSSAQWRKQLPPMGSRDVSKLAEELPPLLGVGGVAVGVLHHDGVVLCACVQQTKCRVMQSTINRLEQCDGK
jgi:hypothetical protein